MMKASSSDYDVDAVCLLVQKLYKQDIVAAILDFCFLCISCKIFASLSA